MTTNDFVDLDKEIAQLKLNSDKINEDQVNDTLCAKTKEVILEDTNIQNVDPQTAVIKAVKDLFNRVQTSSKKERKNCFKNVVDTLSTTGINEKIISSICKVLPTTLHRYHDRNSCFFVENLIVALTKHHNEATLRSLSQVISDLTSGYQNLVPTRNTGTTAYIILKWSKILLIQSSAALLLSGDSELQRLVKSQANLCVAIVASGNQKLTSKVKRLLKNCWSSLHDDVKSRYVEILVSFPEPSDGALVLASVLIEHLNQIGKKNLIDTLKSGMVDSFIKQCISNKNKPDLNVVNSMEPLLHQLTHEDFGTKLLPAIQRALLRNPESIIEVVGHVLSHLSLDLSRYSLDLSKGLFSNLHAKDDLTRDQAVQAVRQLCLRCSDAQAIEKLIDAVFNILNGSEGKLSLATHKISVLEGAGNISFNAVQELEALSTRACDKFVAALKIEVHEKTLMQIIKSITLWCQKFVPKSVIDAVKDGMSKKNLPASVYVAFIELLNSVQPNSLKCYLPVLTPLLEQTIGKANQQAALLASYFLSGLPDQKSTFLWSIVDDQIFFTEKFLQSCNKDSLRYLMLFCEKLLTEHRDRLSVDVETGIYRAIVVCCCTADSDSRTTYITVLKKILLRSDSYKSMKSFLGRLKDFLESEVGEEDSSEKISNPRALADILQAICSESRMSESSKLSILEDALVPVHHSTIYKIDPSLWLKMARN